MSELSFLVSLLLEHKLPKVTKEAVAARIKIVESGLGSAKTPYLPFTPRPVADPAGLGAIPPHMQGQSPSTIAAMMRQEANTSARHDPTQEELAAAGVIARDPPPQTAQVQPVAIVAQTPATAAALADRQAAIIQQISGKPDPGRKSPRKW